MTGDLMSVFRDAPNPPPPTQPAGAAGNPLYDPRTSPATRTAAEGKITSGRGQAPNAATFAPQGRQGPQT